MTALVIANTAACFPAATVQAQQIGTGSVDALGLDVAAVVPSTSAPFTFEGLLQRQPDLAITGGSRRLGFQSTHAHDLLVAMATLDQIETMSAQ